MALLPLKPRWGVCVVVLLVVVVAFLPVNGQILVHDPMHAPSSVAGGPLRSDADVSPLLAKTDGTAAAGVSMGMFERLLARLVAGRQERILAAQRHGIKLVPSGPEHVGDSVAPAPGFVVEPSVTGPDAEPVVVAPVATVARPREEAGMTGLAAGTAGGPAGASSARSGVVAAPAVATGVTAGTETGLAAEPARWVLIEPVLSSQNSGSLPAGSDVPPSAAQQETVKITGASTPPNASTSTGLASADPGRSLFRDVLSPTPTVAEPSAATGVGASESPRPQPFADVLRRMVSLRQQRLAAAQRFGVVLPSQTGEVARVSVRLARLRDEVSRLAKTAPAEARSMGGILLAGQTRFSEQPKDADLPVGYVSAPEESPVGPAGSDPTAAVGLGFTTAPAQDLTAQVPGERAASVSGGDRPSISSAETGLVVRPQQEGTVTVTDEVLGVDSPQAGRNDNRKNDNSVAGPALGDRSETSEIPLARDIAAKQRGSLLFAGEDVAPRSTRNPAVRVSPRRRGDSATSLGGASGASEILLYHENDDGVRRSSGQGTLNSGQVAVGSMVSEVPAVSVAVKARAKSAPALAPKGFGSGPAQGLTNVGGGQKATSSPAASEVAVPGEVPSSTVSSAVKPYGARRVMPMEFSYRFIDKDFVKKTDDGRIGFGVPASSSASMAIRSSTGSDVHRRQGGLAGKSDAF